MSETKSRFLFVVCQNGAEAAAKKEIMGNHPELRISFSRPGFLTFKIEDGADWPEKFSLRSTLARTYGWSLGKVTGSDANILADEILNHPRLVKTAAMTESESGKSQKAQPKQNAAAEPIRFKHLHVWERDAQMPGYRGFEPGPTVLSEEVGELLSNKLSDNGMKVRLNQDTRADDCVLDVTIVEPDQWWFGYHYATTAAGRWPGGVPTIEPEAEPVSRAWYKAAEALAWSGIEIQPDEWCAEIGSAPGGCCQLLLEKGANVIGVDPAEMDAEILKNPKFVHIRRRGNEVRKKDFSEVKWLFADLNIVPNYTLDTITEIVGHASVHVKGLILTMKLSDWSMLDKLDELRARVGKLGFSVIKTRQLAFNRQEFCLIAIRDKFMLRDGKRKMRTRKSSSKVSIAKSSEAKSSEVENSETKNSESKITPSKKTNRFKRGKKKSASQKGSKLTGKKIDSTSPES